MVCGREKVVDRMASCSTDEEDHETVTSDIRIKLVQFASFGRCVCVMTVLMMWVCGSDFHFVLAKF